MGYEVCEICLQQVPHPCIKEIKSMGNDDQSGEDILLFCLGIQVFRGSDNDKYICNTCSTKLLEFHKFKSVALNNQATLCNMGLQRFLEKDLKNEMSQASDNDYDEPLVDYSELETKHNRISVDEPVVKSELSDNEDVELEDSEANPLSDTIRNPNEIEHKTSKSLKKNKSPVPCNICGKGFLVQGLKLHMESHKPKEMREDAAICAHCDKIFARKRFLQNHMIKVHPEFVSAALIKSIAAKKFQCDLCPMIFKAKKDFRYHRSTAHAGCKPICPICNESIIEVYLETHIRSRHQSESIPYECKVCGKKFIHKVSLKRHLSVHTGNKPFPCDICGTRFRLKYSVALHKAQVHDKAKNHVCHICSKRYFTASLLHRHLKRCSGMSAEKKISREDFKCPDCGKPLGSKASMMRHRRVHTGGGYKCKLCQKEFESQSGVKRHMRIHRPKKEFPCTFCPASFDRIEGLSRHEQNKHKVRKQRKTKKSTKRPRKPLNKPESLSND